MALTKKYAEQLIAKTNLLKDEIARVTKVLQEVKNKIAVAEESRSHLKKLKDIVKP